MKLSQSLLIIFTLCVGLNSVFADEIQLSGGTTVEVPLADLLAPYHGYDNTNNVEVVLYGTLPNTCYRIDNTRIEKVSGTNSFRIRQFAVKKTDGVCGEENTMPEHLKMAAPFTSVVSIGSLAPGDYSFNYNDGTSHVAQKSVNVKEAHKTTVDDYPYAAVSNVSTTDVIAKMDKIAVTLSGVFTSSCAYLDADSVAVDKQKDVYVVLPVVKIKHGVLCAQSLTPFLQQIDMESPKSSGHYLVHVRSMNGKSVNRVVEALE